MLIDFTNAPRRKKTYAGANGSKISVTVGDKLYMLKFPAPPTKTTGLSYANSCFSEYLGCHIFQSVGIQTQTTLLGTYGDKVVVACEDFTYPGVVLQDFASLKNQVINSMRNGYGTELSDILETFETQMDIDPKTLSDRFWDMFIVDALIGNWDRHNGNWGFLYDTLLDRISLAPVFDCGSSLYPQADESVLEEVLSNRSALHYRVYEIPTSAITVKGKRLKYFDFITSLEYEGCNTALARIAPLIDLGKISDIIDETPFISDLQKRFYKYIIDARKTLILDVAMDKLLRR